MGCRKEHLVDRHGRTLLERQLERLSPHFSDLMLLGASAHLAYPQGVRSLPDSEPFAGKGPLAGLLAGLRNCRNLWLALLPIDCPFFPAEAFFEAFERGGPESHVIGFLQRETDRAQWLPGLYHRALIPIVEKALREERLSLKSLVDSVPHRFVSWSGGQVSDEKAFSNMNTPMEAALLGFEMPPSSK